MDAVLKSVVSGSDIKPASQKASQKKPPQKSGSRYNFDEMQRIAFENINKKSSGGDF